MGARWVFRRKVEPDNSIRYKARLVIKEYEQRFGVHYTDTYAPVVNLRTVRVLLALAAKLGLKIHYMNIKTVFLNALLPKKERVFMKFSKGYKKRNKDAKELLLLKSLYGLKQISYL